MKHNIIIIGTGGHSSVVLDAIESSNSYEIIGFIDCCKPIGEPFFNYKVLGSLAEIHTLSSKYNSPYFFIAVGEPNTREKIHDKITDIHPTIKYATIIHNKFLQIYAVN